MRHFALVIAALSIVGSLAGAPLRASAGEVTCSGPPAPGGGRSFAENLVFADGGLPIDTKGGVLELGVDAGATAYLVYPPPRVVPAIHASFRRLSPERRARYRYLSGPALWNADFIVTMLSESGPVTFTDGALLRVSWDEGLLAPALSASMISSDVTEAQPLRVATEDRSTALISLPSRLAECSAILLRIARSA
jgi:hypothetical protein